MRCSPSTVIGYLLHVNPADDIHLRPLAARPEESQPPELLENLPESSQAAVLRMIVDAVSDAIIVHSPRGEVLFFNEGACRLLGYRRDEMHRLPPFGWVAPHMTRGSAGRIERILVGGALSFQSSVVRKDGSLAPTEVAARRAETADGPVIVAVLRDVSNRAEAEAQLVYLAFHDPLTGLSNRSALETRLADAITDARRYGDILAVGYIDLDRFKPVNDTYGHETGDAVLITLGQRLAAGVRAQDLVSRIGGDEFVVVLPRLNGPDELELVAERLLSEIRQPVVTRGASVAIDASIGFAVFDAEEDDARTLIVKADVAMYAAKNGTTPWMVWTPEMGMTVG